MECKFDSDMLQEYLEGTIDTVEKIFLEEHLKQCKKCRLDLTRLKLLFYELESLEQGEHEVPVQMDAIRENVLDNLFEAEESKFGLKEFVKQQKENVNLASAFIEYIPGKKAIKSGLKNAGSMFGTASKKGLKYGLRMIQARV